MWRQEFKVILISNERSNNIRTQFLLTHSQWYCWLRVDRTVRGYNLQIWRTRHKTILSVKCTIRISYSAWKHRWICRKWCHTTDVSWLDRSHYVTSIRAIIRCNMNFFSNNGNIKPVPKLANRFAKSLQLWKRWATVKSSQYNKHVAWIMFLSAHVIIKTDRIKWTYLPRKSD